MICKYFKERFPDCIIPACIASDVQDQVGTVYLFKCLRHTVNPCKGGILPATGGYSYQIRIRINPTGKWLWIIFHFLFVLGMHLPVVFLPESMPVNNKMRVELRKEPEHIITGCGLYVLSSQQVLSDGLFMFSIFLAVHFVDVWESGKIGFCKPCEVLIVLQMTAYAVRSRCGCRQCPG